MSSPLTSANAKRIFAVLEMAGGTWMSCPIRTTFLFHDQEKHESQTLYRPSIGVQAYDRDWPSPPPCSPPCPRTSAACTWDIISGTERVVINYFVLQYFIHDFYFVMLQALSDTAAYWKALS